MTQQKEYSTLLTLPTTYNDSFVDAIAALNQEYTNAGRKVYELYGSFQHGAFHSARPAKYLPLVDKTAFRNHVQRCLQKKITFNYLLNGTNYANYEYSHTGRKELEELLHFLCDAGVRSVTVTSPYIIDIINKRFPELEVVVSTIGYVGAKRGIDQFRGIGAKRIVLDVEVNRDFSFLQRIVPDCKIDLEIVVNPVCLYQCHFKYSHYCTATFGSHSHSGGIGHPYNQYYLNWCYLEKLKRPGEFLRSPWVRPEDLHLYQGLGMRHFKIAGRGLDEKELVRRAKYYLQEEFQGNLLALLGWPHWLQFRKTATGKLLEPLDIYLENEKLDGFLHFFEQHNPPCRLGCEGCGHCDKWGATHISYNDKKLLAAYISNMETSINNLVNHIPTAEETKQQQERWNRAAAKQKISQ